MRVISQNGMVDLPYEKFVVSANMRSQCEIIAWDSLNISLENYIVLAIYSSAEKSHRAMEMLRENYIGIDETSYKDKYDNVLLYHHRKEDETKIFQFPKDEDVEV